MKMLLYVLPAIGLMAALGFATVNAAVGFKKELSGKVRLQLPKVIPAAVGIEMNVYFDNVILAVNPANYAFDVTCVKGQQQAEDGLSFPRPPIAEIILFRSRSATRATKSWPDAGRCCGSCPSTRESGDRSRCFASGIV